MSNQNAKYDDYLKSVELYRKLKMQYRDRDIFNLKMVNDNFFHNQVWKSFLNLSHEEHKSMENNIYNKDLNYNKIVESIEKYLNRDVRTFKAFFEMEYEKY